MEETLEESAWEIAKQKFEEKCGYKPNLSSPQDLLVVSNIQEGILIGVKYQEQIMYSKEEVRELLLSQRGNSYVAILTKTRDTELASLAMSAPEPSGKDGWVKQFKKK